MSITSGLSRYISTLYPALLPSLAGLALYFPSRLPCPLSTGSGSRNVYYTDRVLVLHNISPPSGFEPRLECTLY